MGETKKLIKINERDNVEIAIQVLKAGEEVGIDGAPCTVLEEIPRGHKIALKDLEKGERIIKYGNPIGYADRKSVV